MSAEEVARIEAWRSEPEATVRRLRPFTFTLVRADAGREATFYALTRDDAMEMATAWAKLRGWAVLG